MMRSHGCNQKGIVLPVILDSVQLKIPLGFGELQYADLSGWSSGDHPELDRLISQVRALVALGPNKPSYQPTVANDQWVISNSQHIVSQLQSLTSGIRHLGDVLSSDLPAAKDLRTALGEVGKTYEAANSAILRFVMPAAKPSIGAEAFIELERSGLTSNIAAGRGHCGLISTCYFRYRGLRDTLQTKLNPAELATADDSFAKLGTADGDLFRPLEQIGDLLTNESRVVANLLLAGQERAARQRILDARAKLQPLEQDLSKAVQELLRIESSLGYVDSSRSRLS